MNLKSLLITTAVIAATVSTNGFASARKDASEFTFDEKGNRTVVLNHDQYMGSNRESSTQFINSASNKVFDTVPLLHWYKPGQEVIEIHPVVSALLPYECADKVPANVTTADVVKVYLTVQHFLAPEDTRAMTAFYPAESVRSSRSVNEVTLVNAQSGNLFFQKVHSVAGVLQNDGSSIEQMQGTVKKSVAHNKEFSSTPTNTPLLVRGLSPNQSNCFWTSCERKDYIGRINKQGKVASVGLHWILDSDQNAALEAMIVDTGLGVMMTKPQLISKLQALGETAAFKGAHQHVPTLLSLFSDRFSFGATPFKVTGFGGPEGARQWTIDGEASIVIPFNAGCARPKSITFFDTQGNTPELVPAGGYHAQELKVSLNGGTETTYRYTQQGQKVNVVVNIPTGTDVANIKFAIPTALATAADPRKLGVSFGDYELNY
jgi:hypothetical protein